MRILGLALAGVLALSVPIVADADTPGAKMRPAGGMPQLNSGSGTGPAAGARSIEPLERISARPHWVPNRYYGWWDGWPGPYILGGPYTVWGGPYVPYRDYGDWGALWYPYTEWRGPHGGWGNP